MFKPSHQASLTSRRAHRRTHHFSDQVRLGVDVCEQFIELKKTSSTRTFSLRKCNTRYTLAARKKHRWGAAKPVTLSIIRKRVCVREYHLVAFPNGGSAARYVFFSPENVQTAGERPSSNTHHPFPLPPHPPPTLRTPVGPVELYLASFRRLPPPRWLLLQLVDSSRDREHRLQGKCHGSVPF